MKNEEKKVKLTEEVKKEVQTEEEGVELTDEQLTQVTGGDVTSAAVVGYPSR